MLFEIADGFFCDPEDVRVVKKTGKDTCALFNTGQSPVDGGFALDSDAAKIANEVNNAISKLYGDESWDEGEPRDDEARSEEDL
jgi:hypothetical protein